jgi:hypothetical protein
LKSAIETVDLLKRLHNLQDRNATFLSKILNALGLRALRFKTILVDKELRLRVCRPWDVARLKTRFDPGLFLQAADWPGAFYGDSPGAAE